MWYGEPNDIDIGFIAKATDDLKMRQTSREQTMTFINIPLALLLTGVCVSLLIIDSGTKGLVLQTDFGSTSLCIVSAFVGHRIDFESHAYALEPGLTYDQKLNRLHDSTKQKWGGREPPTTSSNSSPAPTIAVSDKVDTPITLNLSTSVGSIYRSVAVPEKGTGKERAAVLRKKSN